MGPNIVTLFSKEVNQVQGCKWIPKFTLYEMVELISKPRPDSKSPGSSQPPWGAIHPTFSSSGIGDLVQHSVLDS